MALLKLVSCSNRIVHKNSVGLSEQHLLPPSGFVLLSAVDLGLSPAMPVKSAGGLETSWALGLHQESYRDPCAPPPPALHQLETDNHASNFNATSELSQGACWGSCLPLERSDARTLLAGAAGRAAGGSAGKALCLWPTPASPHIQAGCSSQRKLVLSWGKRLTHRVGSPGSEGKLALQAAV